MEWGWNGGEMVNAQSKAVVSKLSRRQQAINAKQSSNPHSASALAPVSAQAVETLRGRGGQPDYLNQLKMRPERTYPEPFGYPEPSLECPYDCDTQPQVPEKFAP